MNLRRLLLGILGVLIGAAPLGAQSVETQVTPGIDFRGYKTYEWKDRLLMTRQSKENQDLINQALLDAFNAQLKAKGLTENPNAPDIYLTYKGGSMIGDAKSGARYSPGNIAAGQGQSTYIDTTIPGSIPNVWVSMQGILHLEVSDAKTKTVVWSRTLTKKIKDPGRMPKDLDKTAGEIAVKALKDFPPK